MSSPTRTRSLRRSALIAGAIIGCAGAAAPTPAPAATTECGSKCISVFSSELGTMDQPNYVEAVLDGGAAKVGQPVGLKRASRFDPSEDIVPVGNTVSGFYAKGLVSAAANRQYGDLNAVQQKYAPFGIATDLCVGLPGVARQSQGLVLQSCDSPTTVWIPHFGLAQNGSFPIINATTTDFSRPFAMHLPRDEVVNGRPLQMESRRLQFRTGSKELPARQLWGVVVGVVG